MAKILYPPAAMDRGPGFWLRPANLLACRGKLLRLDYSNAWRYDFGAPQPPDRSVPISGLLPSGKAADGDFRFLILGDTGEGDHSQYGLVPLIRALNPDFLIINGDVAYPAGRIGVDRDRDDFLAGFFEPYRNMNCPIWATMGNHEYYSDNNGQEFYETFCTRKYDDRWAEYGLRHDPLQPGTYWELDNLGTPPKLTPSKLVILGLDSGKNANLDGHNDWWQVWKRPIQPDVQQHQWLESRLKRADSNGGNVIILFHIPALVREERKEEYLNTLHKILSSYSCVKAVIAAHEHNFQFYPPSIFRRYLEHEELKAPVLHTQEPNYIVAGSSGASLEDTLFKGNYQCTPYPSPSDWRKLANLGEKVLSSLNMNKSALSDLIGRLSLGAAQDGDLAMYLTCILVEVDSTAPEGSRTVVTPVFLNDVEDLFGHLSKDAPVDVTSLAPPVDPAAVAQCLQKALSLQF